MELAFAGLRQLCTLSISASFRLPGTHGCAGVLRDPRGIPADAIPVGECDSGAIGQENAITTTTRTL